MDVHVITDATRHTVPPGVRASSAVTRLDGVTPPNRIHKAFNMSDANTEMTAILAGFAPALVLRYIDRFLDK